MKAQPLKIECKPILKWAGGKRQLEDKIIGHILKVYPDGFEDYYEPFAGGAAVFFALRSRGLIRGQACLSDTNPELIEMYTAVRDDVEAVLRALEKLCTLSAQASPAKTLAEARYYVIRASKPKTSAARAARMIYLNKNGFNGLYRVNKSGGFNVPWGKRKTPYVPEADEIRAASAALQGVTLASRHFSAHSLSDAISSHGAARRAFFYFDPPYVPIPKKGEHTPSFTAYTVAGFTEYEQRRLADTVHAIGRNGEPFLLSNSDTKASRALYKGLTIKKVQAKRSINSVGASRGAVSELLVSNSKGRK